jgi:membrane protein DedA with SNARE-associated domain
VTFLPQTEQQTLQAAVMIGILIGGVLIFLIGRWYSKSIERLKSVRLLNPSEANGKVGLILQAKLL